MLSDMISLLLMMLMPILLYMGIKARIKKDASWKIYLVAAGGEFILLAIIAIP